MILDDHDRCGRCGSPDGPSHTTAECERMTEYRAEAQRVYNAATLAPADRCGAGHVCAWMRVATDAETATHALAIRRREMEHPDTFAKVVRYVVALAGTETRIVRACPACGGNPNETQVTR